MKIIETVRGLVESKVNELGYRVYDIDFGKEPEGYVLTIYIDAESPITLDDCEKVSRAVEPVLNEADPITQPYYLSVSSIGLDRPLTIDEDFKRNLGKQIDIKLYAPLDLDKGAYNAKGGKAAKKQDKRQLSGILEGYDAETFTVRVNGVEDAITISKKSAAVIKPHIDF